MTVKPKINICINGNCNKITFIDNTGLYNSTTNPYGWSNNLVSGNLRLSDMNSASVTITDTTDSLKTATFILKSDSVDYYPANATPFFEIKTFDWTLGDGIYDLEVSFTVDSPDTISSFNDTVLITCNAENCVKDLYLETLDEDCKCSETEKENKKEKALQADVLLSAVNAQFLCNDNISAIKTLKTLAKICELLNNDCNCK